MAMATVLKTVGLSPVVGSSPTASAFMKLLTWNVNGLRAILRKDFDIIVSELDPDIVCLQETKTNQPIALPLGLSVYQEFWQCGQRPGYAGTLTLVRKSFDYHPRTLPSQLAEEGRTVLLDCQRFYLLNTYFPNGGRGAQRLAYKMNYYKDYLDFLLQLDADKPVIFGGDINTAHQEIDLARPKENSQHTGFLPQERAWLDEVVTNNFVDVWRTLHPGKIAYTWWDYKTRSRSRNVGWRIDYWFVSARLLPNVQRCRILTEVEGSDHAPILLELSLAD